MLRVNSNRGDTPHLWLKPTLTPEEQARLSGDPPQPEPEPISEPEPELAMEAEAEPSVQPTQDTQVEPETQPERDVEPEPEADAEPERAPALEEEPRSAPEPDLKLSNSPLTPSPTQRIQALIQRKQTRSRNPAWEDQHLSWTS